MNRDYNYEGKAASTQYTSKQSTNTTQEKLTHLSLPRRVYTLNEVPDRYHIVSQLSEDARQLLEAQCSALFLDCIDYDTTSNENAIAAYDVLYSLYCDKFNGVDLEDERNNEKEGEGLQTLIQEIEDWNMSQEGSFKFKNRSRGNDVWFVVKIIFGIFAAVLTALYYVGVYYSLFDEDAKTTIKNAGSSTLNTKKKLENDPFKGHMPGTSSGLNTRRYD